MHSEFAIVCQNHEFVNVCQRRNKHSKAKVRLNAIFYWKIIHLFFKSW